MSSFNDDGQFISTILPCPQGKAGRKLFICVIIRAGQGKKSCPVTASGMISVNLSISYSFRMHKCFAEFDKQKKGLTLQILLLWVKVKMSASEVDTSEHFLAEKIKKASS